MNIRYTLLFLITLTLPLITRAEDYVLKVKGTEGPGKGKTIVLVSGDEEYRSEESMPMLAQILARHHGFNCIVLFSWDNSGSYVDPDNQSGVRGWKHLDNADLMLIGTRFRTPNKEDRKHIASFLKAGKPIIGIRTSTHAFKGSELITEGLTLNQFGPSIIGDGWVAHHGKHKVQGTRAIIEAGQKEHPILNGVADIFAPTDVYTIRALTDADTILMSGQVTESLDPDSKAVTGKINKPMMPLAWLHPYQVKGGKKGSTFTTTAGASVDLLNEDLRRLLVNAVYFMTGLKVPPRAEVTPVKPYTPTFYGFASKDHWKKRNLQIDNNDISSIQETQPGEFGSEDM